MPLPHPHGRLFVLDGNNIAYRAFFALPDSIATSAGFPTNALYGFCAMMIKILSDYCPDGVIDVGYRVGIHMKSYKDRRPVIVAGGRARDFFGEYMAGGELILLGLGESEDALVGSYVGTGMHGGLIFLRGAVEQHQLGKEVAVTTPDAADAVRLADVVGDFCRVMGLDVAEVMSVPFVKLFPYSSRPYGKLYAY